MSAVCSEIAGRCASNAECSNGAVCDMTSSVVYSSCLNGVDSSVPLGECKAKCDLESTKQELARLNSLVRLLPCAASCVSCAVQLYVQLRQPSQVDNCLFTIGPWWTGNHALPCWPRPALLPCKDCQAGCHCPVCYDHRSRRALQQQTAVLNKNVSRPPSALK